MSLEEFYCNFENECALFYKSPLDKTYHKSHCAVGDGENNLQRQQAAGLKILNAAGSCHAPQECHEALRKSEMFPVPESGQQFL